MSLKLVRKAVIPVAGLGTRFLPVTKSVPKEMLPLVDTPTILYVVQEAISAGIEDIIFITGRHKSALEEFFDRNYELEDQLDKQGKTDLLKIAQNISKMANIVSIRQKNPLGLGHAVYCAKSAVGSEPFAVLLGDEIMFGKPNVTEQLVDVFKKEETSTIAIMEVAQDQVSKYGIAKVGTSLDSKKKTFKIEHLVEKPTSSQAPSRWALPGRYVFSSEIFGILENTKPSKLGEIQLTDAMNTLSKDHGLLGHAFDAERFDAGDKLGYIQANITLALRHPEIGAATKQFIIDTAKKLERTSK